MINSKSARAITASILIMLLIISNGASFAAQVVIQAPTDSQEDNHRKPLLAFTSDQVGYAVYTTSDHDSLRLKKTINGGASWNAGNFLLVSGERNTGGVIWYDRWTHSNSGNDIHILSVSRRDSDDDHVWYTRFDSTTDTSTTIDLRGILNPVDYDVKNRYSITRSTTGDLYIAILHNGGGPVMMRCSSGCSSNKSNWSVAGTNNPLVGVREDEIRIVPLIGGKILGVQWDVSASIMYWSIYDPGTNLWSAKTFLATANYDDDYRDAWGLVSSANSGGVYLVFNSNVNSSGGSIRVATFSGSGWNFGTNVVTDEGYACDIFVDLNTYDLYVIRIDDEEGRDELVELYKSSDMMQTWTNMGYITNIPKKYRNAGINQTSTERAYAWFYEDDAKQLDGALIADFSPVVSPINTNQSIVNWFGIAP